MNKYKKPLFEGFHDIYSTTRILGSIKATCNILDQLNISLFECIPEQFIGLCHFGAIDQEQNVPVLFVNEPQILHKLKTMSEHILRHLNRRNYSFDGILFKTKLNLAETTPEIRYKKIDHSTKNKLKEFASLINMPDLVLEEVPNQDNSENEIDL